MHINGGDTMLTLTPVALATANAFVNTLITLHQREHIKPILEVKRVKRNE